MEETSGQGAAGGITDADRDARNTQSNLEEKSGEGAAGGITDADGDTTIEDGDEQPADNGGKEFISFLCMS